MLNELEDAGEETEGIREIFAPIRTVYWREH